jgi:hypothetical protein
MDKLEQELKDTCLIAPHWMQLQLQAFWYGLLSWCITCAEDKRPARLEDIRIEQLLEAADKEFVTWPTDWLHPIATQFLTYNFTEEELHTWFDTLDTIFRDTVPTDLDIFTTLADGNTLTEEQWTRLYEAIAFLPPQTTKPAKATKHQKTRRTHGRRAITPLRRRRALTYHRPHQPSAHVIKMSSNRIEGK